MEEKFFEDYVKEIVGALRQISALLYHNSREMKRRYGISGPQLVVLRTIVDAVRPLSAIQISRILKVSPSNITGMVDRLEKMGFAERRRNEDDRRTINVFPTASGKELAQRTIPLIEEKLIKGLKDLTHIEISSIYLSLEKIIQIAGEEKMEDLPIDQLD
jgi:DNA-binding MarR family transcriptional regulator